MNVDFVPFIRGVLVLSKPRLVFSRINGPNVHNSVGRKRSPTLFAKRVWHGVSGVAVCLLWYHGWEDKRPEILTRG